MLSVPARRLLRNMNRSDSREALQTCPTCGNTLADEAPHVCNADGRRVNDGRTDPLIGSIISNRYLVAARSGEGATGVVYKVRHAKLNHFRALKVLNVAIDQSDDKVQRFYRETRAAGTLEHANIVQAYDTGLLPDGRPYIVMEWIEGLTLSDHIRSSGAFSVDRALPLFAQIADALSYAHRHKIVHRDIKPSNIIIATKSGGDAQAKVLDFGLAKFLFDESETAMASLTRSHVVGTPAYMSPEQCLGKPLDGRADVYSLGCMMYETLCGQKPCGEISHHEYLMWQISAKSAPPLRKIRPDGLVPPRLESIVSLAMAKDLRNRYATADELSQDVQQLIQSRTGSGLFQGGRVSRKLLHRELFSTGAMVRRLAFCAILLSILVAVKLWSVLNTRSIMAIEPRNAYISAISSSLMGEKGSIQDKLRLLCYTVQGTFQSEQEYDFLAAERSFKNALSISKQIHSPATANIMVRLGSVYYDSGHLDMARMVYQDTLSELATSAAPDPNLKTSCLYGIVALTWNSYSWNEFEAARAAKELWTHNRASLPGRWLEPIASRLASDALKRNQLESAAEYLRVAFTERQAWQYDSVQSLAYEDQLSQVLVSSGQYAEAKKVLDDYISRLLKTNATDDKLKMARALQHRVESGTQPK